MKIYVPYCTGPDLGLASPRRSDQTFTVPTSGQRGLRARAVSHCGSGRVRLSVAEPHEEH